MTYFRLVISVDIFTRMLFLKDVRKRYSITSQYQREIRIMTPTPASVLMK